MKTLLGLVRKAAAEGWGGFDTEEQSDQEVADAPVSTRPEDVSPDLVEDLQERTGVSQDEARRFLAMYFAMDSAIQTRVVSHDRAGQPT